MEKKVKREWVTWKELNSKYQDAEETVHRQCVELDAWREKYRKLAEEVDALRNMKQRAVSDAGEAIGKRVMAEEKLKKCEEQLQKMKDHVIECNKIAEAAKAEVKRLRSRGWLARLLNR